MSKVNPRLRVRCPHCTKISKTRHLDFDIICTHCKKYISRAGATFKKIKEFDKSNQVDLVTYIPKEVVAC